MKTHDVPVLAVKTAVFLLGAMILSGCAAKWTEVEYGPHIRVAPGFAVGESEEVTVHPVAAFSYLMFDGGHDDTFHGGVEVRKRTNLFNRPDVFLGGAVEFIRYATKYDDDPGYPVNFDGDPKANGVRLSALGGVPIGEAGPFEVNLVGAASYWRYGDFKDDMDVIDTPAGGSVGLYLGIDLQLIR